MNEKAKPPGHDIFCTPENSDFISKVPYQSLSKSDQEIRLLKILPDSGSGFVECELLPGVPLAKVHKQYLALSYCAGSAENTKPIKVNCVTSNVFANLHHALTSARHYWETSSDQPDFLLWVDQICINQFDLAERSHQVGFMRDIYHNAKQTLICLSTSETNGRGMRWLIQLRDIVTQERIAYFDDFITGVSDMGDFINGLTSFSDIITSPWWGRAWVFQEFMVSTHATFLYGRYAMSDSDFSELAIQSCRVIRHILRGLHSKSRHVQQLETSANISKQASRTCNSIRHVLKAKREEPSPTDLGSLLVHTRDCQASDRRDKIYSLLGLVSPGYGITPDYSPKNDVPKLLVEVTRRIIAFEDSLSILSNLNRFGGSLDERAQLPSWVVDWIYGSPPRRNWSELKMGYFTDHKINAGSIDASFAAVSHPRCPGSLTTILQVWAIFLDTGFQRVGSPGKLKRPRLYEGSQHYFIQTSCRVESDQELWILCGAREPFVLSRYRYGYRLHVPALCTKLPVTEEVTEFPEFMDDQGVYDTNKMDWKKINIF